METKAGWQFTNPDEDWMNGFPHEVQDFSRGCRHGEGADFWKLSRPGTSSPYAMARTYQRPPVSGSTFQPSD